MPTALLTWALTCNGSILANRPAKSLRVMRAQIFEVSDQSVSADAVAPEIGGRNKDAVLKVASYFVDGAAHAAFAGRRVAPAKRPRLLRFGLIDHG
jgi:hypothetical protein